STTQAICLFQITAWGHPSTNLRRTEPGARLRLSRGKELTVWLLTALGICSSVLAAIWAISTNLPPTAREPLLPRVCNTPETWRSTNPVICLCPSLELLPTSCDTHRMEHGPPSPPP